MHYNSLVFLRLSSKFAYIFVAIELLTFFINAKFHFYCSRELSVIGIKKNPVRKHDWFFAFSISKNSHKNIFVYKWKLQWLSSAQDNLHVLIYTKSKNNCETFLITKSQTLFKKQDNFRYVLYRKSKTLYVTQFFKRTLDVAFTVRMKMLTMFS